MAQFELADSLDWLLDVVKVFTRFNVSLLAIKEVALRCNTVRLVKASLRRTFNTTPSLARFLRRLAAYTSPQGLPRRNSVDILHLYWFLLLLCLVNALFDWSTSSLGKARVLIMPIKGTDCGEVLPF